MADIDPIYQDLNQDENPKALEINNVLDTNDRSGTEISTQTSGNSYAYKYLNNQTGIRKKNYSLVCVIWGCSFTF